MHRPVGPPFAVLARAIDRIDDPHALLAEPFGGILAFLGEQAVIGPGMAQRMDQELVGGLVPRLAQRLGVEHVRPAHFAQDAACGIGQVGGKFGIGQAHRLIPCSTC